MKSVEQPLYLKLSSIYNKILQLVSAILLIIALIAMWLSSVEKSQDTLSQHFELTAQQFLQQGVAGVSALLDETSTKINKKTRYTLLQKYLNQIAKADFIKAIHLYDASGLLLLTSEHENYTPESIKGLFGIEPASDNLDISKQYRPFIAEIRPIQLQGYLRITIEESLLITELKEEDDNIKVFYALLLIIAVLVGVLLSKAFRPFTNKDYKTDYKKAIKPKQD